MFPWKGERGINQYGERENEKWEQNRDLEMKWLIRSLSSFPVLETSRNKHK